MKDNLIKVILFFLYLLWYLGCMIILVVKYICFEVFFMVCILLLILILYLKRKFILVRGVVEVCSVFRKIGFKLKWIIEKLWKLWSKWWKFKWFKFEFFLIMLKLNIEEIYIFGGEMRDFLMWLFVCVYMK